MPQNEEKLELFRQAILEKANAQKEAVRQETEARKKKMLDEEESKLLESFYRETQTKIQKIKAQNIKELGQESQGGFCACGRMICCSGIVWKNSGAR